MLTLLKKKLSFKKNILATTVNSVEKENSNYELLECKLKLLTVSSPLISKKSIDIVFIDEGIVYIYSQSSLNIEAYYVLDITYKKEFIGKMAVEISKEKNEKNKFIYKGIYDEELSLKIDLYISPNRLKKLATMLNKTVE